MTKEKKTNAMRMLDKEKISYESYTYDADDGKIDGVSVAEKVGKELNIVYKTLVAQGTSKALYVFIVPVAEELHLKKAALAINEKKIELIPVKDIMKHTGYIRGGCSPIGMKKLYKTVIDHSIKQISSIVVSGGKIGMQIELDVDDLIRVTNAQVSEIV